MVYELWAQMRNVSFVETGFTIQMDFIVVLYSATISDVLSNSQFHFQSDTFKVSCI
jgi:hypothetical protein